MLVALRQRAAHGRPVQLRVIQPSEVISEHDRFRCEPLSAVLAVHSCLARQAAARPGARDGQSRWQQVYGSLPAESFVVCRDCSIGRDVAKRVKS